VASDFRISTGLPEHLKTRRVISRLGTGAMWHWVCLCAYTAQNHSDGNLSGISIEDIEIAAKWPDFKFKSGPYKGRSSQGVFVEVLLEAGFLEKSDAGIRWHDWDEHQLWVIGEVRRKEIGKLAADKRWEARRNALIQAQKCIAHAESIAESESEQCPSPILSSPNLTKPIKPKPSAREARDDRFSRVKDFIQRCCTFKQVPFIWDASEGKQLKSFLQSAGKETSVEAVCSLIRNRFNSKEPPGDRPRIWLSNLGRYATVNGNGKQQTYAERNEQSIIDAVKTSIARDADVHQEGIGASGDSLRPADDGRTIDAVRGRPARLSAMETDHSVQPPKT
jgi:hypothetical protein